eukprot:1356064-Prorocentrum_lima.AAC.1
MALRGSARGGTRKKTSLVVRLESLGGTGLGCVQWASIKDHLACMQLHRFTCGDDTMRNDPRE